MTCDPVQRAPKARGWIKSKRSIGPLKRTVDNIERNRALIESAMKEKYATDPEMLALGREVLKLIVRAASEIRIELAERGQVSDGDRTRAVERAKSPRRKR